MKSVIIIPALNPDEKLISVVDELKKNNLPIVVINDGSRQECDEIFERLKSEYQCDICVHKVNMGKGNALKTGIRYASVKYPDSCGYVTADADGQHAAGDILKTVEALEKNQDSLIVGTRNFSGKNIPFKSRWGNRITSLVFMLSMGKRCPDTQTGLRGIPGRYTKACLSIPGERFQYEMNMLLEFARSKIPFVFVPISTIYLEGNKSSHFHAVRDSVRIYLNILKYSLSSLGSAFIDLMAFTALIGMVFGRTSAGILAATVIARCMSGLVNFLINKHWVFQSKEGHRNEMMKYFTLFICQMMLSWLFVTSLSYLSDHITVIKIFVDTALFFVSYQIQKNFIFNKKRKGAICDEKVFGKTL